MNIKSKIRNPVVAAMAGGLAALLLAGGTATAAATIGSEDIKDGSILRKDLNQDHLMYDIDNVWRHELAGNLNADINQVWSSEIVNKQVEERHLSDDAKNSLKGEPGEDGVSGHEVIGQEVVLPAGETLTRVQPCPGDKVSTGGGYKVDNPADVVVFNSMPSDLTEVSDGVWSSTGWQAKFRNDGASKTNVTVFANCAAAN